MEELKHRNDIEIKLLPNRRFIYANRRSNIVLTAENRATEITVLFPDEYEHYSKRVDFVNSQDKEWTEGLYTPEYSGHGSRPHEHGYKGQPNAHAHTVHGHSSKLRFRFSLPTEVTTPGELKMQFLAYLPDETMTTVPFEIITIDVLDGILAFKKNARSNPDLLILSANLSKEALFKSEQAKAKSKDAVEKAEAAVANSFNAVNISEQAKTTAESADAKSDEALAAAAALEASLADETAAREQGDAANAQAIQAETSARVAAIEAEAQARTQADADLQANITAETERAMAAEQAIEGDFSAAIEAEQTARIQGDETNAAAIEAEATERAKADVTLRAVIEIETERALAAEGNLQAQITAEKLRAETAESNLQTGLTNESSRSMQAEAQLRTDLNSEITRAQSAESAIAQNLTAETQARTQKDTELQSAILAEAATRAQADSDEQFARMSGDAINAAAIQTEMQRAVSAENNLQAAINIETNRAQAAENIISGNLLAETMRAQQAEQLNTQAIVTERNRAQAAEGELQAAIASEATRATTAESTLAAAIATETTRATVAEAGLAASVVTESTRAQTQEALLSSAITGEIIRATNAEADLRGRLDNAIGDAVEQANAYTDEVVEQVRIDGTVYRGTILESELPTENRKNGDLYWISEFDITKPEHSGSAIWNGETEKWDFNVDKYKHEDGDTIVPRDSDGALKVADTDESGLTADTDDYGATVKTGFKATIRNIIRKIKGLFQRTAENATAISAETTRATTAEAQLALDISTEVAKAETAIQIIADAVSAETARAEQAEQAISQSLNDEVYRAMQAEQQNANAIADEAMRAQTAENNLQTEISQANTTANNAEYTAQQASQNADQAYQKAESAEYIANDANYRSQQAEYSAWDANNNAQMAWQKADSVEYAANNAEYNANQAVYQSQQAEYAAQQAGQQASDAYNKAQDAENAGANEAYRAQSAESGLASAIASEESARIAGDDTNAQAIAAETSRAQTAENGKVDKVVGKELSTEDYTTAEKTKLAGIAAGANNYTHPTTHPPSVTAQDANNRFVTDTEKSAWNNKAEKTAASQSVAGLMSAADKTKLDNMGGSSGSDTVILAGGTVVNISTTAFMQELYADARIKTGVSFIRSNCAVGTPVFCDIIGICIEKTSTEFAVKIAGYGCKSGGTYDPTYYVLNARVASSQITASSYLWAKHYFGDESLIKANQNVVTDGYGRMVTEPKSSGSAGGGLPICITGGTSAAFTITAPELGTAYKNGLTFIMIPHTGASSINATLSVNGLTGRKFYRQNGSGNGFYPMSSNDFLNTGSPLIVSYRDSTIEPFWVLQGLPLVFWENVTNRPSSLPASDVYAWAKATSKPTYSAGEVGAATAAQGANADAALSGLAGKVDKIAGKGLSTEDFTTAEKSKLTGLTNGEEGEIIFNSGIDCVNIQMDYYSETLEMRFFLQGECLMPRLENLLGEGIWDEIADNGYLLPNSDLEQLAIMAFIIAASGGKASISFMVDEGVGYTTPISYTWVFSKYGPDVLGLTARLDGEDVDLLEMLGDSELSGIYILPNSGSAPLGMLLAMLEGI